MPGPARCCRYLGLALLGAGAALGIAFAAFITGQLDRLGLDPLRTFVVTAAGTILLVPTGLVIWIVASVIDRKRP